VTKVVRVFVRFSCAAGISFSQILRQIFVAQNLPFTFVVFSTPLCFRVPLGVTSAGSGGDSTHPIEVCSHVHFFAAAAAAAEVFGLALDMATNGKAV
jgi:hypothetical protein